MNDISRREALSSLGKGSAGLALGVWGSSVASAHEAAQADTLLPRVFNGNHQPRPLPFEPSKLKGLSEKLIRSHWENNYVGAVNAINAVEKRLGAMFTTKDLPPYIYGDLKREELVRTGSVVLHEMYFANLGGDNKPGGKVLDVIKQSFDSYSVWEHEFRQTASALGGGSGWVIFAQNSHTGEFRNYWSWDHMHNIPMSRPLLVLDMYEHAYHMDYGAAAAKYIDAFLQNINWEEVNRRTEALPKS